MAGSITAGASIEIEHVMYFSELKEIISILSAGFPRVCGSFTMIAGSTTVVVQPAIKANSIVLLTATNASAGAKAIYVKSLSAGESFTVAVASDQNADGDETFSYAVVNPA